MTCLVLRVHLIAFYKLFASCDEFLKIQQAGSVSYIVYFMHSCFLKHSKYSQHCLIHLSDCGGITGVRSTCLFVSKVRIFVVSLCE